MTEQRLNEPTPQQTKYLGYLLSRAHELGMPHLNTDGFSRRDVSAWIDFLAGTVVKDIQREQATEAKEEGAARSPSLPIRTGTFGYRPPLGETTSDHLHEIEPWATEDGWEILECVVCGDQW